mmetsp:Transcript_77478/g.185738  ORF Transcript_77478/g.185738 Transcript_77478/m.185738 type:complete len:505 (-) Transcript_77478:6731-8245(-)
MQGGAVVVVCHPGADSRFNHLPDLVVVVLRRSFAQRHPELHFAHLRALLLQQPLHHQMLMANGVIQRCEPKTIEGAQVEVREVQHLLNGLVVTIRRRQVQGRAVVVVAQVGVHSDHIHQKLQLGGVSLRRRLTELDRGGDAGLELGIGLDQELGHLRVSFPHGIVQGGVPETVLHQELGPEVDDQLFHHREVPGAHREVQGGAAVQIRAVGADLVALQHRLHLVPLPLRRAGDEVPDPLLLLGLLKLFDLLSHRCHSFQRQVVHRQLCHEVHGPSRPPLPAPCGGGDLGPGHVIIVVVHHDTRAHLLMFLVVILTHQGLRRELEDVVVDHLLVLWVEHQGRVQLFHGDLDEGALLFTHNTHLVPQPKEAGHVAERRAPLVHAIHLLAVGISELHRAAAEDAEKAGGLAGAANEGARGDGQGPADGGQLQQEGLCTVLEDGQLRQPLEEDPPPNALQQAVGEVGEQHFDGANIRGPLDLAALTLRLLFPAPSGDPNLLHQLLGQP